MASSAEDIAGMLAGDFDDQVRGGQFDADVDEFMQDDVIPVWQANAPVDSGNYEDLIEVTDRAQGGKGRVGATDEAANIIEYGSEDTPEFAPMARTVAYFDRGGLT